MAQKPTPNDNNPEPTEQLPLEPVPVRATSAASGGATGLDTATAMSPGPKLPAAIRRHPLAAGITAGVIAVILVSGLTAWGVGTAVTASLTSATSQTPMVMPTAAPTGGPAKSGSTTGRLAFRATIQSMNGTSWGILTKKGKTVTVMVDGATQFGTKKATATAASFAVGDNVIIVASRGTGGMPTATRIVKAPTGS